MQPVRKDGLFLEARTTKPKHRDFNAAATDSVVQKWFARERGNLSTYNKYFADRAIRFLATKPNNPALDVNAVIASV